VGSNPITTLLLWCKLLFTRKGDSLVRNEFTSVIEQDGEWFIGYCPEIPGANGQGRTIEECRANLSAAIALILEDRREDGLRGAPSDAIKDTVVVQ
jgi:predicted RNase H-like HicB family nuclease